MQRMPSHQDSYTTYNNGSYYQTNGSIPIMPGPSSSPSLMLPLTIPPETSSVQQQQNGQWKGKTKQALDQIAQSLQPYQQSIAKSQSFGLSSESSSGSDARLQEAGMLDDLVNMGFDKESSFYALKLTAFRGVPAAVEILLKANNCGVFRDYSSPSNYENGGVLDSCSSRSDSPSPHNYSSSRATPVALPQRTPSPFLNPNALKRSQMSLNLQSTQSLIDETTVVRSRRVEKPMAHSATSATLGATSPFIGATYNGAPVTYNGGTPATISATSATLINVPYTTAIQNDISPPHAIDPSCSSRQPTQVMSAKFDRDSVSTVQINVAPGNSQDGQCINYRLSTKPRKSPGTSSLPPLPGVQRITIDETGPPLLNPYNACDKSYIEELCKRVSSLLGQQSPLGKRDSTASSAGSECSSGFLAPDPHFSSLMHGRSSPVSSLSTESSSEGHILSNGDEGPIRCISPVPESSRIRVDSGDTSIKPCTPKAFKFFMELHVENVIKQYKERQTRVMQLEHEMQRAGFEESWMCQMRRLLADKESRYLRLRRQRMDKSMFDTIKKIGAGAFAEVYLTKKKDTETLYAMKMLRKSDVIKRNQAAHVKAERDILSEADNEWVVKLYYSFQDKDNLFFIMEYIPGGDMMNLLMRKSIFSESLARFYIAELVCAIESVHKLGFIHRDIKPDNILIDEKGHIKLTDFGLCTGLRWTHDNKYYNHETKPNQSNHEREDSLDMLRQAMVVENEQKVLNLRHQRQRQKAHSLVGTPNYIAPEVLMRTGHTQLCDWWSVGVILYEMVVGRPPFYSDRGPADTQLKVIRWKDTLFIPENAGEHRKGLQPQTKDLILKLCCGVQERLGRGQGAQEIKVHPYFKSINFANLRSSRAPYIPEIRHSTDTSNFDLMDDEPAQNSRKGSEPPQSHDHAFYEFTFRRFFDSDPLGCPTFRRTPPRAPLTPLLERHNADSDSSHSAADSDATVVGDPRRNVSIICVNNANSPAHSPHSTRV